MAAKMIDVDFDTQSESSFEESSSDEFKLDVEESEETENSEHEEESHATRKRKRIEWAFEKVLTKQQVDIELGEKWAKWKQYKSNPKIWFKCRIDAGCPVRMQLIRIQDGQMTMMLNGGRNF